MYDASLWACAALQRVNVNSDDLLCKCPGKRCTSNTSGALLKREASSCVIPFIRLSKVVVIAARPQTDTHTHTQPAVVQSGCDVTWITSVMEKFFIYLKIKNQNTRVMTNWKELYCLYPSMWQRTCQVYSQSCARIMQIPLKFKCSVHMWNKKSCWVLQKCDTWSPYGGRHLSKTFWCAKNFNK